MAYAVIDLGTNTFHLLIVELNADQSFKELYRKRSFIQLAENGINRIGEAPFQRGLEAMKNFSEAIQKYPVEKLQAFGTAAFRRAENGAQFIQEVLEQTGIQIEIISGDKEAELITKGVRKAVPEQADSMLIMDIGGGSVEFIIAGPKKVLWAKSFQIGVAILFNRFHKSEPISQKETEDLKAFLRNELASLFKALEKHPASRLVGASGTFDVLEMILSEPIKEQLYTDIATAQVFPICKEICSLNGTERFEDTRIPTQRAKLIVVAILLIEFILLETKIEKITVSAYAMKEGILSDLISV